MDIRGIEVTNQLRSAIRAKLLELGVRYDEELPDYILVMVVNKKTRQQMHDDLNLFLEASTAPFVEWLHDQVLKKLQKVTIAKKKTSRDLVPTVVVKQEEERKKRKNNAANAEEQNSAKVLAAPKEEKPLEKNDPATSPTVEKFPELADTSADGRSSLEQPEAPKSPSKTFETPQESAKSPETPENTKKTDGITKELENRSVKANKRVHDRVDQVPEKPEKRVKSVETENFEKSRMIEEKSMSEESEETEEEIDDEEDEKCEKRLKSCVNRPKITSVVSVKTRLGTISPRKKFEIHRSTSNRNYDNTPSGNRPRQQNPRNPRSTNDFSSRGTFSRSNNQDDHSDYSRSRATDFRARYGPKIAQDTRNRQFFGSSVEKRFERIADTSEKATADRANARNSDKSTFSVKDRLGSMNNRKITKMTFAGKKSVDSDVSTSLDPKNDKNGIKNRLGPVKNRSSSGVGSKDYHNFRETTKNRLSNDPEPILEDYVDDDEDDEESNVGPIKSRIIAVRKMENDSKRTTKQSAKKFPSLESTNSRDLPRDDDDNDPEVAKSIASKVIVTPRPLKPLQPIQKRATQSLLLRAVAEANQSVVKQKNPEPVLTGNISRLKRLRPPGRREVGKNLSVHLNATKRLVMEKIQVQLNTEDTEDDVKTKKYESNPVSDDHIGVVMSLFHRSDDNQKFLVTLNGYNNNVIKDKTASEEEEEEEERLDMEVTEDEEIVASTVQTDEEISPEISSRMLQDEDAREEEEMAGEGEEEEIEEVEKIIIMDENNENRNMENVEKLPKETCTGASAGERKRRKLSPIVYTRSRSCSPVAIAQTTKKESLEKRSIVDATTTSNSIDKSREKCRYWPNCTLGMKCAYYHPGVPCSAFPACKFGDKCAYKHPNCKFGLSCTKLGCAFSHPKQKCKYHPYCTKPNCAYSHPATNNTTGISSVVVAPVGDTTRAKFSWKRRD